MKKFSFMMCIMLTLCLSVFSFSGISLAEQADVNNCIKSCEGNKKVCLNMNPDVRLCEAQYKECVTACKEKKDTSSSTSPLPAAPKDMPKDQTPQ